MIFANNAVTYLSMENDKALVNINFVFAITLIEIPE